MGATQAVFGLLGGAFFGVLFWLLMLAVTGAFQELREGGISSVLIILLFGIPSLYLLGIVFDNDPMVIGFLGSIAWIYTKHQQP